MRLRNGDIHGFYESCFIYGLKIPITRHLSRHLKPQEETIPMDEWFKQRKYALKDLANRRYKIVINIKLGKTGSNSDLWMWFTSAKQNADKKLEVYEPEQRIYLLEKLDFPDLREGIAVILANTSTIDSWWDAFVHTWNKVSTSAAASRGTCHATYTRSTDDTSQIIYNNQFCSNFYSVSLLSEQISKQ